jgi:hypothetical protein
MVPEAQLIPLVELGPVQPNSIATLQLAAPAKTMSARVGYHRSGAAAQKLGVLLLCERDTAQRRPHHCADRVAVFARQIDPRVDQREPGCGNAEPPEPIQPASAPLLLWSVATKSFTWAAIRS